jgi:hypothetical protein
VQLADRLKSQKVPVQTLFFKGGHEFEGLTPPEVQAVYQQEFDFIKSAPPR